MRSLIHFQLAVLILLSSHVVAAGQQEKAGSVPPPQANDYFPERWKEFTSREGKFKILFPGTPVEWTKSDSPSYTVSYTSFIKYTASFIELPGDVGSLGDAKGVLDKARESVMAISVAAQENPQVVKEVEASFQGYPGRILQIDSGNNKVIRYKFILVKNRLYYAEVITPKGRPDTPGAENDYEKIAMTFLDSFSLIQ
jgi:hypothetical protein